ncbi:Cytochrome P450, partial [Trinorchestia longiramus]
FSGMIWVTLALLVVAITSLFTYERWRHGYWKRLGVYSPPTQFWVGHFLYYISRKVRRHQLIDEAYKQHKNDRMIGLYDWLTPSLTVLEPSLVQTILIKDFDHFIDRRSFVFNDDVIDEMLTNAKGSHWKGLRSVMSPTFSSGKMKNMFHLVKEKANVLVDACRAGRDVKHRINMPSMFGNFTMDTISSCAFGLNVNSLNNENSPFIENAKSIFQSNAKRMFKFLLMVLVPSLAKVLGISMTTQQIRSLATTVKQTIIERQKGPKRGDFVDLMLEARESGDALQQKRLNKFPVTDEAIVAQSILFILAGYDTTSNSVTAVVFSLAKHALCQEKLREELRTLTEGRQQQELTYQDIMEAPYLDAAVAEALRLYPPTTFTERRCTKAYRIPDTSITVPEGMLVSIPIWSLHRDSDYFPDPDDYQPERFLPGNKEKIPSGAYLPFGLGPRMCIAQRFALMEVKLAVAKLILNFRLKLAEGSEEMRYKLSPGNQRPEADMMVAMEDI